MSSDELTRTIKRARSGDRLALERVAASCYDDIRRLCASLVDPDAADDLAQETVIRIVRGVRGFRAEASARTWVLAIARRVCMDELRARSRQARRDLAISRFPRPTHAADAAARV